MARVLGASSTSMAPPAEGPRWVYADTGHPSFGKEVDFDIVADPSRFWTRGSSALADRDGEVTWIFCENVSVEDEPVWRSVKQTGPGKDERIEAMTFDGEVRHRVGMQVITKGLAHDIKRPKGFPLPGPSAYAEFMQGIEASGVELGGYHNWWVKISGISPTSAVATEHKIELESFRHGLQFDGLAGRRLAMFEYLSRRLLMIHRAVKKNAKHPNFEGLESMLTSSLDESGGVVAMKFDQYVAEQQRTQAQIMKQSRLMQEEMEHEHKRNKANPKGGGKADA